MQTSENIIKINLDTVLAILFIVSSIVPYFSYWGRGEVLSYSLFLAWLIPVVSNEDRTLLLLKTLQTRRSELLFLFIFFLIALFNYLFVTTTSKAFQFTLMPITYFFLIIMDAYYYMKDPRYKLSIFFFLIIILGVQAAISLPYIFTSDELVSRMYTSGELDKEELKEAVGHGVGSANLYATLCGIFFYTLGIIHQYKKSILRFILLLCLLPILLSIISSSYSVSFTMLTIGGLIFLARSDWSGIRLKHILSISFILIALAVFYTFFLSGSQLLDPIQRKLNMIETGNLRDDGRMDLALKSINTFINNPFFGVGVPAWGLENQIGEHAPWVDFPAHYGILGFLPFIMFLIILFRRNWNFYFSSSAKNVYATACLTGTVIFNLSNFIDPLLFEPPMIIMLIFFYTSMLNWGKRPIANYL